jgi:presequence protease
MTNTTASSPTTADTIHGFEFLREQEIPELRTRARLFRHVKTGAQVLSLENDDENKCFGVAFRTPTFDSTGVPHILEHSVLGGSRKYPVKEPFNELLKGSLKTFLNAMTYPDKTVYPVASTNLQDFYNLVDVYLDAVFHPLITPDALAQEGWRFEVDEADGDPAANGEANGQASGATGAKPGKLTYKGVVLNEMKGANASPERVLYERIQESLFPDTIYRHSSGGRPADIPDLTYEQFRGFHQTYYHPANARIFFYGDDDPDRRLQLLDEYLREFDAQAVDSTIPLQPRFDAPRRVTGTYAVGPEEAGKPAGKKARLTVNWLLDEVPEPAEALALEILEHILLGTPASPLRRALIESGLGEELAGGGLSDGLRQWTFSAGLRGIAAEDADKVEALILGVLHELAERGLDREMIEASLNTIEFRLRENNTGQFPRGLSLMLRALATWLYDGDPLAPLAYEAPLAAVKGQIGAGAPLFEDCIRRFLLDNPHRTVVLLLPDEQQGPREEAAEQERLAQAQAGMSPEEIQAIVERARELKRRQEQPDPPELLARLPRLTLADLERKQQTIPLTISDHQGARVLYHDLFTNGIVYLDVGFDLHTLPADLLPYARLFSRALLEMGTSREDYVQLSQRIGRQTGGIRPASVTSTIRGTKDGSTWLLLRGKALASQQTELLDILRDLLLEVRLDNQERFRQMVREERARQEASLIPGGHAVVGARLGARFHEAGWAAEQIQGLSHLLFVRQLAQTVDSDWPRVLADLERFRQTLFNRASTICNVTVDETTWTQLAPRLHSLLDALPSFPNQRLTWTPEMRDKAEAMTIPGQTNFVGKGADLYRLGYTYHGSVDVITHYLGLTWLWEQVRVRSGAYGVFCGLDRRSGVFTFTSYRDPNLLATLEKYDQSPQFLRRVDLGEDEVTKAIIGTISRVDPYLLPDAKGWISLERYLAGETDETLQIRRDQILSTTADHFRAFAEPLSWVVEQGQVVVLGSDSAVAAAVKERPDWLEVWSVGL